MTTDTTKMDRGVRAIWHTQTFQQGYKSGEKLLKEAPVMQQPQCNTNSTDR
jgi:hypothetical protein